MTKNIDIDTKATHVLKRLADPTTTEVAVDTETSGLDWRKNKVVGWVYTFSGNPNDSFYIPIRHGGGENLGGFEPLSEKDGTTKIHPFEVELNRILHQRGKTLRQIGHNILFDMSMAKAIGVDLHATLVEDTQVNQPMINEFSRSYSLSNCCKDMGVQEKKGEALYSHMARLFGGKEDKDQMGNFWRLAGNDPVGVDYAEGDGTSTWQLMVAQRKMILEQGMGYIHDIERRLTRTLFRMSSRGIPVDETRLVETIDESMDKLKKLEKLIPKDLNPRSPKEMAAFMRSNGITDWPTTATGRPSFTKEWLLTNEPGKNVVAVREISHLINSFLVPLRDRHLFHGRVNPSFHQLRNDDYGTITGRLSCSDPNMQQAHKRNKVLGKILRRLFIALFGYRWRSADYSQCEPRLLAHYGNVRVLIEGYLSNPPVDAHSAVANQAGIDRQAGKTLNQSLITGAGRAAIVAELGPLGDQIYDRYFAVMPEIKALQKNASSVMRGRGYVTSILGRRVRLEPPRLVDGRMRNFDYKAVNRLLQTGNADIMKESMVKIDEMFEETGDVVWLLNNVHDSMDFMYPEDGSGDDILQEAMRMMVDYGPDKSTYLRVPLGIEYGDGKDWAEATWPEQEVYYQ